MSAPGALQWIALLALVFGCACEPKTAGKTDQSPPVEQAANTTAPPDEVDGPMLPDRGGDYAPSLLRVVEDEPKSSALSQVDECAECHAEIVEQWRGSMHAFASFNNPLYRKSFDDFVASEDREKGRFCAGCHDPTLLVDKTIDAAIDPEEPRAHMGVTCGTCHGIEQATYDGNASYTLTTAPIPIPTYDDPESIRRHIARVDTYPVDDDTLCASCHRGFLSGATGHDVFIQGIDDFRPWRRSGWAENPTTRLDESFEAKDCADCHMPKTASGKSSHRFPGGHSAFAKMIGDEAQYAAVEQLLKSAATLDIAAVGLGDSAFPKTSDDFGVSAGERVWFDVVVRNTGVGHQFPGGVKDLKDTWIEVVIEDARGHRLAQAGVEHAETGSDDTAHRLRVLLLDESGEDEEIHNVAHFRTPVYDHTISPRAAAVVRYAWTLPEDLTEAAFPLKVRARLRHRRLMLPFQKAVCDASKTERGRAFTAATRKYLGVSPDPCVEQPIIDMTSAEASLASDSFTLPAKLAWKRWFERGLGLQSHLSERLVEAHDSFDRALAALGEGGDAHKRAMVLTAKAQVFARQGSDAEAIALFDRAEELVGAHPTLYFGRGAAHARVWRFDRAVAQFERAAELVDDDRVWRKLAHGQGSLSQPVDSLLSARNGLALEPRDPDMLRSQLLALRALDVPADWVAQTEEAYDDFKRDEDAHLIQAQCADRSEICRKERLKVHTHELEPVE